MIHDWSWKIQAAGQGPDWYFSATFADADYERLAAFVGQYPLPGFAFYRVTNCFCARHGQSHSYDLYIDQGNYAQLVANFENDHPQNIWIYHTITVCECDLMIERGYGGYPGLPGTAETNLIAALAQAANLTLLDWQVSYGGQGYTGGDAATGTTAAALLAYLHGTSTS